MLMLSVLFGFVNARRRRRPLVPSPSFPLSAFSSSYFLLFHLLASSFPAISQCLIFPSASFRVPSPFQTLLPSPLTKSNKNMFTSIYLIVIHREVTQHRRKQLKIMHTRLIVRLMVRLIVRLGASDCGRQSDYGNRENFCNCRKIRGSISGFA